MKNVCSLPCSIFRNLIHFICFTLTSLSYGGLQVFVPNINDQIKYCFSMLTAINHPLVLKCRNNDPGRCTAIIIYGLSTSHVIVFVSTVFAGCL